MCTNLGVGFSGVLTGAMALKKVPEIFCEHQDWKLAPHEACTLVARPGRERETTAYAAVTVACAQCAHAICDQIGTVAHHYYNIFVTERTLLFRAWIDIKLIGLHFILLLSLDRKSLYPTAIRVYETREENGLQSEILERWVFPARTLALLSISQDQVGRGTVTWSCCRLWGSWKGVTCMLPQSLLTYACCSHCHVGCS